MSKCNYIYWVGVRKRVDKGMFTFVKSFTFKYVLLIKFHAFDVLLKKVNHPMVVDDLLIYTWLAPYFVLTFYLFLLFICYVCPCHLN